MKSLPQRSAISSAHHEARHEPEEHHHAEDCPTLPSSEVEHHDLGLRRSGLEFKLSIREPRAHLHPFRLPKRPRPPPPSEPPRSKILVIDSRIFRVCWRTLVRSR